MNNGGHGFQGGAALGECLAVLGQRLGVFGCDLDSGRKTAHRCLRSPGLDGCPSAGHRGLHVEIGIETTGTGEIEITARGKVEAPELVERFARYFLNWVNRWQDDGFAPVKAAWLARTAEMGSPITLDLGGRHYAGTFAGLDDAGALVLDGSEDRRTVGLAEALRSPTWSL